MLTQDHVQKKQKETRMHKNAAQAHNGVRATASMPFSAAVSCCFKNILAPGIPVYKANGLVKMPLVKKNMKGGQPLNCDVETAGKTIKPKGDKAWKICFMMHWRYAWRQVRPTQGRRPKCPAAKIKCNYKWRTRPTGISMALQMCRTLSWVRPSSLFQPPIQPFLTYLSSSAASINSFHPFSTLPTPSSTFRNPSRLSPLLLNSPDLFSTRLSSSNCFSALSAASQVFLPPWPPLISSKFFSTLASSSHRF